MRQEQVAERLEVVPFMSVGGYLDPVAALARFRVGDARCYDPNELAKLRAVIGAVGEDHFNDRIRELAKPVKAQMEAGAQSPSFLLSN